METGTTKASIELTGAGPEAEQRPLPGEVRQMTDTKDTTIIIATTEPQDRHAVGCNNVMKHGRGGNDERHWLWRPLARLSLPLPPGATQLRVEDGHQGSAEGNRKKDEAERVEVGCG